MEEPVYRPFADGDQGAIVELLRGSMSRGWGTVEAWEWKYRLRPGFDPRRVFVAELHGELVACLHTTSVRVRHPDGSRFRVSLEGDFAVAPRLRGGRVTGALHEAAEHEIQRAGDRLRGGFSTAELHERLYRPRWGYRMASARTVELSKAL